MCLVHLYSIRLLFEWQSVFILRSWTLLYALFMYDIIFWLFLEWGNFDEKQFMYSSASGSVQYGHDINNNNNNALKFCFCHQNYR